MDLNQLFSGIFCDTCWMNEPHKKIWFGIISQMITPFWYQKYVVKCGSDFKSTPTPVAPAGQISKMYKFNLKNVIKIILVPGRRIFKIHIFVHILEKKNVRIPYNAQKVQFYKNMTCYWLFFPCVLLIFFACRPLDVLGYLKPAAGESEPDFESKYYNTSLSYLFSNNY